MISSVRSVAKKSFRGLASGRLPLLGDLPDFRADSLAYLLRTARLGDIVPVRIVEPLLFLNRPEYVQHVLQERHSNYEKGALYERIKPLMGNGLITSEGSLWKRQRKLAQPAFSRERLPGLVRAMGRSVEEMRERWERFADSGEVFDAHAEANRVALQILGETLFGGDLVGFAASLRECVPAALALSSDRMYSLFAPPLSVPTPFNLRYRRTIAQIDGIVSEIIARRRRVGPGEGDLLSMWMTASDPETGGRMSDVQLRDEAVTMLLAGHETVAVAVSFAWYLLSLHPGVAEDVADEAASVLGGEPPTLAHAARLAHTTRVIQETMRLFPPGWIVGRRAKNEDEIGGHVVPAGRSVFMSPYSMHRHPAYWDNPEAFDPGRFLPERSSNRPRYAYFPFAGGPRQCIGSHFAMLEAQIFVAMVTARYELNLEPGYRLDLEASITLRPRRGIGMTVRRRGRRKVSYSRLVESA